MMVQTKSEETRGTHTQMRKKKSTAATGPRVSFATAPRGKTRGGEGGETQRRKEVEEEEVNRRVVGEDVLEARERRVRV